MAATSTPTARSGRAARRSAAQAAVLFRRWQQEGDRQAREVLVCEHLSLARKLAGRYARTQEPFDDLFQVASLGLVKAIDRFDPDRGIAFASFAVPTILGELKRHFRDRGWSVHLPRKLQELVLKVQEAQTTLSSRTGSSPTVQDLAQYMELPHETVVEALEASAAHHAGSLDAPLGSGGEDAASSYHDLLGGEDERYAMFEASATLRAAIRTLPVNEQRVLELRMNEGMTQQQIADRIGVSQMQVSRILRRSRFQLQSILLG